MTTNQVAANRWAFINQLETNPDHRRQIFHGEMTDSENGRCALGLGCEALGIELRDFHAEPYDNVTVALGYTKPDEYADQRQRTDPKSEFFEITEYIWRMNDMEELSFADIAARLRKLWHL